MSDQRPEGFIYCRISQDRSGAELGVTRQREACERLAESEGIQVRDVFIDNDKSAFSGSPRPDYEAMTARLAEVDYVIVWQSDRLYRRVKELEAYIDLSEEHSVSTLTTTREVMDLSTSGGRFQARLYTVLAARESEIKGERSRLRAEQTLKQGRHVGGPRPFGWDLVPRTEEERSQKLGPRFALNDREATAIREAADALLIGRSIGSVLREWSDPKRPDGPLMTTQFNPWSHAAFRKMLQRPRNAGIVTSGGTEIARNLFEAPLSYPTWRAVVRLLESRSRPTGHAGKAKRLAVGIATCPCGLPVKTSGVSGRTVDPATGERPYIWTYFCKTPGTGHVSKRVDFVDDAVRLAVSDLFWQPLGSKPLTVQEEARKAELSRELRELEHRYESAAEDYANGHLTVRMLGLTEREITARRSTLDDELTALEEKSRSLEPSGDPFGIQQHTRLMRNWLTWHLDDQRDFVRSRLRVELLATQKSAPRILDPHSVRVTVLGDSTAASDDLEETGLVYPGARIGPYWHYLQGPAHLRERATQFQNNLKLLRRMEREAGLC